MFMKVGYKLVNKLEVVDDIYRCLFFGFFWKNKFLSWLLKFMYYLMKFMLISL